MRILSLLALVGAVALVPAPAAAQVSARIHVGGPIGGWIEVGNAPPVVYLPRARRMATRDYYRGPGVIVVHRGKHRHDRYCRRSGYDRLVVYYDRDHDRYYDRDDERYYDRDGDRYYGRDDDRYRDRDDDHYRGRDDDRYRGRNPGRGRGWQRVEIYRHDGRYYRSR